MSLIVILNDGETFSTLEGSTVAFVSDSATTEDIEDALREGTLVTSAIHIIPPATDWLDRLDQVEINSLAKRIIGEDKIDTEVLREVLRDHGIEEDE